MRVTTAGVARNGTGQYFVGKRKASKNLDPCWEFPGGKTKPEEKPEEALKREFYEEFGIEIEVGPLLCTGEFNSTNNAYLLKAYLISLRGKPKPREHLELAWKSLEELDGLPFAPSDTIIINALREGLGND